MCIDGLHTHKRPCTCLFQGRVRAGYGRVDGRVRAVYTAVSGRVHGRVHGRYRSVCEPCTRALYTAVYPAVFGHVLGWYTSVYAYTPRNGRVHVYTAVTRLYTRPCNGGVRPCTRPCTCRVHDGPCTGQADGPCTRPVYMYTRVYLHGREQTVYTAMYGP